MPYGQYNIVVEAAGYETLELTNAEVLPQELSLQPVPLIPTGSMTGKTEEIVVPGNTLYVPQTPKIPETEVKPVTETGEIVLSRVVIPEYIRIISKMWHPVKSMRPGRMLQFVQMYLPLCHLH